MEREREKREREGGLPAFLFECLNRRGQCWPFAGLSDGHAPSCSVSRAELLLLLDPAIKK